MDAATLSSICRAALALPNVRAFLRMLRVGEGTSDPAGYRRLFGGDLFDSYADHPRIKVTRRLGGKPITSTAAGAYQHLARTWDECRQALDLPDFSPDSQDMAAVFLIRRRRALDDVIAGRVEQAIKRCALEWASLPGSPYGQPVKTMAECLKHFATYLAEETAGQAQPEAPAPAPTIPPAPPAPQPQKEQPMAVPAFILAALPALFNAVPELLRKFGDPDKVKDKHLAAVQIAVDVAKNALGARNEQELVHLLERSPDAPAQVREAVLAEWGQIDEVGGGIAAAREANAAGSTLDPKRNLALWITFALLPLVYMTVGAVLFASGWADEVRAMVVATVVSGILGAVTGYWLGTSFSSARKDERAGGGVVPLNGGGPRPVR